MIEILVTNDDGGQTVVGHFFIESGKVVSTNEKYDWMLDEPCYTADNKKVMARTSPEQWLDAMPYTYSGTRVRARKV